jgi:hypothetical protein
MRLLTSLVTSLAVLALAGTGPALAKECRIPDPVPGVRAQLPPDCRDAVRRDRIEAAKENVKGNQGFIDLGNGTQVRIGGRVRGEVGISR